MGGELARSLMVGGYEVKEGKRGLLVAVTKTGALMCVDGRRGDQNSKVMSGPKILGGLLGVMAFNRLTGREGFNQAISIIRKAGYVPGVHLDTDHGVLGCGFGRLLQVGQLTGLSPLGMSIEEIVNGLRQADGVVATLYGKHEENIIRINMVPEMTLVPDGSAFNLDLWVAKRLGINQDYLARSAIETVQKLNGPRRVEIFL